MLAFPRNPKKEKVATPQEERIFTPLTRKVRLGTGQRLGIGEARLEVTMVCTPCSQMERIRPGLRKELWGRRGMLCRVLAGGIIRPGDSIEKLR